MGRIKSILRYLLLSFGVALLIVACNTPQPNTQQESQTNQTQKVEVSNENKININTAILSELDKLESELNIPALSDKIQANRPYGSTEDLVTKNVITSEQFEKIKNQVTVREIALTGVAKDVDYLTKLGLMKGHMMVAEELLDLNKPKQADPHLGHPVEEIYADIEEQLNDRQVPQFSNVLTGVQELVKSNPKSPQVKTNFNQAMEAIENAIAALPESEIKSPTFVLKAINGILDVAAYEYKAAIHDGKIVEIIEYQDSRGFVEYSKDVLYKNIAPELSKIDPKANQQLKTDLEELFKAWPSPLAPKQAVLTPETVTAKVKSIGKVSRSIT